MSHGDTEKPYNNNTPVETSPTHTCIMSAAFTRNKISTVSAQRLADADINSETSMEGNDGKDHDT